jgi:hypothetical protein
MDSPEMKSYPSAVLKNETSHHRGVTMKNVLGSIVQLSLISLSIAGCGTDLGADVAEETSEVSQEVRSVPAPVAVFGTAFQKCFEIEGPEGASIFLWEPFKVTLGSANGRVRINYEPFSGKPDTFIWRGQNVGPSGYAWVFDRQSPKSYTPFTSKAKSNSIDPADILGDMIVRGDMGFSKLPPCTKAISGMVSETGPGNGKVIPIPFRGTVELSYLP